MALNKKLVLVVDLDGTLVKTNMLFESFWSALGCDTRTPLLFMRALLNKTTTLEDFFANKASIDVGTLPYNSDAIAYIQAHRKEGGRAVLLTTGDKVLAEKISQYLGIFDEVCDWKSDRKRKGEAKADFIIQSFTKNQFLYMGNSNADFYVWKHAKKVITVNAEKSVRLKAETLGKPFEHLGTINRSVSLYISALRVHQWLKNLLLFLPMLMGHQLNWEMLKFGLIAFISFSFVASSVYILNDLKDLTADRAHPRKCRRPFASGAIPIVQGSILAVAFLTIGMLVATFLGPAFSLVLAAYYIMTLVYSIDLKRRIVLDIVMLAGFYTTRIVAGGVATGVTPSVWLLAFSIFFFFSLAAVKRQAELVDLDKRKMLKVSGRGYQVADMSILSMAALGSGYVSILVMALYVNSPTITELYSTPDALWGICCVLLYWQTRIVLVTHRGHMNDDHVLYAAKDRNSQICFLLIMSLMAVGIIW